MYLYLLIYMFFLFHVIRFKCYLVLTYLVFAFIEAYLI